MKYPEITVMKITVIYYERKPTCHIVSLHYVPGTLLNTSDVLTHKVLIRILRGR